MSDREIVLNCNIIKTDRIEVETNFSCGHDLLGLEFRGEEGRGMIVCLNRSQVGELIRTLEGAIADANNQTEIR